MAPTPTCFQFPLILVVALAISGCAASDHSANPMTAAPPPPEQGTAQPLVQAKEFQAIIAELRRASECVTTTEAKPDFAPLRAKAPPGGGKYPYPSYFLDKSHASATEQKLIGTFLEQIAPCRPNFAALTVREHRNITRMITDTWAQQAELYQHLKEGVITWGIFNQGTRSNSDKLSGGLQALRLTNEG